jgi:hypothetical protein
LTDAEAVLSGQLASLCQQYPKLLVTEGIALAFIHPPSNPDECLFSKMSANYSADLQSRVEPCVFGGEPDCSQCGCAISSGLHWIRTIKLAGPVKIDHFVRGSIGVGLSMNRLRSRSIRPSRWHSSAAKLKSRADLVQIQP